MAKSVHFESENIRHFRMFRAVSKWTPAVALAIHLVLVMGFNMQLSVYHAGVYGVLMIAVALSLAWFTGHKASENKHKINVEFRDAFEEQTGYKFPALSNVTDTKVNKIPVLETGGEPHYWAVMRTRDTITAVAV